MFFGCSALTNVNLSSFNTSNVTTMQNMFSTCTSLEKLDISSFNTNNVTSMYYMFYNSNALKDLNLGRNFVIKDGCDIGGMFSPKWTIDYTTSGLKIKAIQSTADKIKTVQYIQISDDNFDIIK